MGRNIPEVLYIQNCYFYGVLVFKMQRHVGSKRMHARQIRDAQRGGKENFNITIITEELMEFHNVREFKGNLAAYNSFY